MEIALRLPILSDAATILSWENNPENWDVSDNDSPYSLEDIINLINSFHGVEKPEQLGFLEQEGCDKVQGYLFSEPVPQHRIPKLIESIATRDQ